MKSGLALLAGLPAVAMFFNRKSALKKADPTGWHVPSSDPIRLVRMVNETAG